MIELSVLVPVYNVRQWLPNFVACLPDALAGVNNYEVIFLDDGSSDNSGDVLEHCLADASGIKNLHIVRHKDNQGVSRVRQDLLLLSKGEYFIYADPDDWMESGMYSEMLAVARAKNAEIVWEDYYLNNGGKKTLVSQDCEEMSSLLLRKLLLGKIHGSTCNKLFSRLMIEKSYGQISFPTGRVDLGEDLLFVAKFLKANPRVAYTHKAHYHYRVVTESATHRLTYKSFAAIKKVEAALDEMFVNTEYEGLLGNRKKSSCLACFLQRDIDDKYFYEYINDIRNLDGLATRWGLKVLYRIAAMGYRKFALALYDFLTK